MWLLVTSLQGRTVQLMCCWSKHMQIKHGFSSGTQLCIYCKNKRKPYSFLFVALNTRGRSQHTLIVNTLFCSVIIYEHVLSVIETFALFPHTYCSGLIMCLTVYVRPPWSTHWLQASGDTHCPWCRTIPPVQKQPSVGVSMQDDVLPLATDQSPRSDCMLSHVCTQPVRHA